MEATSVAGHESRSTILPWPATLPKSMCATLSVGERGVTCRQFKELTRFVKRLCRTGLLRYTNHPNEPAGSRVLWTKITMFEVCYNVIVPVIKHIGLRCSWSTLVSGGRSQRPDTFISHSWEENFRDFVESFEHLQQDRGLTATDVVWICTFANNQFELRLGERLSHSPFFGALEHARDVALFLDHTGSALLRSWCNFELAITTDTKRNRRRWAVRQLLASQREPATDKFQVEWAAVDEYLLSASENSCDNDDEQRRLLLCTPAGMVGTQRVTSGPVLKAIQTLTSARGEAANDVDRRRIMNHIAHNYLVEPGSHYVEHTELHGLKELKGKLALEDTEIAPDAPRRHGPGNRLEYTYEQRLTTGKRADKFRMLDENIFLECKAALERRGLHAPPSTYLNDQHSDGQLVRLCPTDLALQESGLALSQLRDLEVLLISTCEAPNVMVDGKKLEWNSCTSRHLFSTKVQSGQPATAGKSWEGLTAMFMPPNATYAECVNKDPRAPDFYVIIPRDMILSDAFQAIERHAEALRLSDRTTYFIHPFSMLSIEDNAGNSRPGTAETTFPVTTEGVVLLMNEGISNEWRQGSTSLWCFYELWLADQNSLPWDVACDTGVVAASRPFGNGKWECGSFNPIIAENLARVNFNCTDALCNPKDREMILSRIASSPGGVAIFNETMSSRLAVRMLSPTMRYAAYTDNGEASMRALNDALRWLEKHRCKYFVNLQTFQGSFGETPLHIMAARRDLGEPRYSDLHAVVLALVHAGFGVNDQDDEGETPLHWAAFAGATWTTRFLLRQGANPMIVSYNGERPLQIARARPTAFLNGVSPEVERMLEAAITPWCRTEIEPLSPVHPSM